MDGITEITEVKQTKIKKLFTYFTANADKIALMLLILWCALPAFMTFYHIIAGAAGAFPTEIPEGMALGSIVYRQARDFYYASFCIIGGVTLFYALICVFICVPRIFDKNSFKGNIWFYLLAALLVWAIISAFASDDFGFAFTGGNYMHDGLLSYFFYAGVFLCASMIKKEKHRRILLYVFCGVLSWLCAVSLLREAGIPFLEYCFPTRHSAVFSNSNHFGYVLCIGVSAATGIFLFGGNSLSRLRDSSLKEGAALPQSLRDSSLGGGSRTPSVSFAASSLKEGANSSASLLEGGGSATAETEGGKKVPVNKIISLCFLILFTVTLLINNTFGAFIGAAFGLAAAYVFYFVRRGKVKWYVFLPVLIFILLTVLNSVKLIPSTVSVADDIQKAASDVEKIVTNDESAGSAGSSRWALWKTTVQRILERPVFGFGPEGFVGENALDSNTTGTHNEYLQIAGYLGIPALLLYLSALVTLAVRQWKRLKRLDPLIVTAACGTVGYLVSAFVGAPVFNTAPFFWLFLGLTTCGDEPPLLSPEETNAVERLLVKSEKKRAVKIIIPIAIIGVIAIIGMTIFYNYKIENSKEKTDLQSMRIAESAVILKYKNSQPEGTETYWFDCLGFALIPADEKMPAPYGLGEQRRGGATNEFIKETGKTYEYDEAKDYRNKIIKVEVSSDDAGKIVISVEWVEYKE